MELIPKQLRRAHEDGQVVFFCGAGVSIPAGLPSYWNLVRNVLSDLLPTEGRCQPGSTEALAWEALRHDRYDEALEILESPQEGGHEPRNVRERVRHHLLPKKTKSLAKHLILCRLADLDSPQGRLVTTNFDHLFEKAQQKLTRTEGTRHRLTTRIAPVLPPAKPQASTGLTYLHGKLDHSANNSDLVLTMSDFGVAYLLEGWARRFVVELFRHYHVVFIGYRVEDPTMRYLVSALLQHKLSSSTLRRHMLSPHSTLMQPVSLTRRYANRSGSLSGYLPLLTTTAMTMSNSGASWQSGQMIIGRVWRGVGKLWRALGGFRRLTVPIAPHVRWRGRCLTQWSRNTLLTCWAMSAQILDGLHPCKKLDC